jgi:hypothetical protein
VKAVALYDEQAVRAHVLACADLLAAQQFERVGAEFGFALAFGRPRAECIREAISGYRSEQYFPGEHVFTVSDWRAAIGGNPKPRSQLQWYKPSSSLPRGLFEFDLPLNGKWSDLLAEFVLFESSEQPGQLIISLEDISSPNGASIGVA